MKWWLISLLDAKSWEQFATPEAAPPHGVGASYALRREFESEVVPLSRRYSPLN